MDQPSPYSLFGLDLSQYAARAVLGWRQLLWSEEVGLKDHFCPPVRFINPQFTDQSPPAGELVQSGSSHAPCLGWLIPDAEVLIREMTLPTDAEIFLRGAVLSPVQARSPFDFAETSFGFRIAHRNRTELIVRIAMVLRATAQEQLRDAHAQLEVENGSVELWVEDGAGTIMLEGFGERTRSARYHANLRGFAIRTGAAVIGTVMILSLPALWMAQHAGQLVELKSATQARVGSVVAVREELVKSQELNAAAQSFFDPYVDYGPWLHELSAMTPDQVYFQRLGLDGITLTVSGLAENAADYQSILAEAGLFNELVAPSAFTRDDRAGRERFTLSMRLMAGLPE